MLPHGAHMHLATTTTKRDRSDFCTMVLRDNPIMPCGTLFIDRIGRKYFSKRDMGGGRGVRGVFAFVFAFLPYFGLGCPSSLSLVALRDHPQGTRRRLLRPTNQVLLGP